MKNIRIKMLEYEKLIFQKALVLVRQIYQNNVMFVTIGFLKISVLNINLIFVMDVMI